MSCSSYKKACSKTINIIAYILNLAIKKEAVRNKMVVLIIQLILLISIFSRANAKTPGQVLDESLQNLSNDIKIFKIIHGKCAPCLSTPGIKDCDCRNLAPKKDCLEFLQSGVSVNGLYKVMGKKFASHYVYCDQTTHGGGWTVIQRRKDGSENFYRNWNDYKDGFGNLDGEFWLGNENIHDLTRGLAHSSSLLIELKSLNNLPQFVWAKYNIFEVGDAASKYLLKVSRYSGNAGDNLSYHNNQKFSTYDQDNDSKNVNCAFSFKGAWWFNNCLGSHLNGVYRSNSHCGMMTWNTCNDKLTFSEMKIKRNI